MADETQPEAPQEPLATPADPSVQTVSASGTEAEVTPDPSTPSTSPEPAAATSGSAPDPTQFKKDELVTAAQVQGVEVEKGDTKADIAEKLATPAAKPIVVSNFTARSDEDAQLGSWVDVVSGEYAGRRGAYVDDAGHDPQTGYPSQIIVRTRDAENELIVVDYSDARPSSYTGGR